MERDYPEAEILQALLARVPRQGIDREQWLRESGMVPDSAESAAAKLWVHGGVRVDGQDWVTRAEASWQQSYEQIRAHRKAQLEAIVEFARGSSCRMVGLIRHFGDASDDRACGLCDGCVPASCVAARFRHPDASEAKELARIVLEVEDGWGLALGTLYRRLYPREDVSRQQMEHWVDGLVRAGALRLVDDSFEKDGQVIRFRRAVRSKPTGIKSLSEVELLDVPTRARAGSSAARERVRGKASARAVGRGEGKKANVRNGTESAMPSADAAVAARLRAWRLQEAKQKRIPAFRVLTDATMYAIAAAHPATLKGLRAVRGVGDHIVTKYGAKILDLVRG
jgi:DNA topoisomerase-3